MKVTSEFIRSISQRVKILQAETTKELTEELVKLPTDISFKFYKSWIIENFIPSINHVFNSILEKNENNLETIKEQLYNAVLSVNPQLEPENLYISEGNNVSFTKSKKAIKISECDTWKDDLENSNLVVFEVEEYYKITENARRHDHYLQIVDCKILPNLTITVRQYNKKLKQALMQSVSPKTQDDVKYFVIVTCIDNIQALFSYLTYTEGNNLPMGQVINALYDISIEHNPFLKVKVKDFTKLNKNVRFLQEGTEANLEREDNKLRKSLQLVPKKEIMSLYDNLSTTVFGQDDAIKAICRSVQKAYNGLKNSKTPIGSFFIYGPTSTGKTEIAKAVAKTLTGSASGLIKISCNTLNSSHSVHTLIGSPPGYVGYEEKGLLYRALEFNSFKVILFDEVEKAHNKIFDIVLEMMEEGEILMADGEVVKVNQCIIIFTSNIGQEEANNALNAPGFISNQTEEDKEEIQRNQFLKKLKETLKPEFLARLTGTFYFARLKEDDLLKIARLKLDEYKKLLSKKKIEVSFDKSIPNFIIEQCKISNPRFHARDVRNFIDMSIIENLGDFILQNQSKSSKMGCSIDVLLESNAIKFNLNKLS